MSDVNISVRMDRRLHDRLRRTASLTGRRISDVVRAAVESHCADVLENQRADIALRRYVGALSSLEPGNSGRVDEVVLEILERSEGRP